MLLSVSYVTRSRPRASRVGSPKLGFSLVHFFETAKAEFFFSWVLWANVWLSGSWDPTISHPPPARFLEKETYLSGALFASCLLFFFFLRGGKGKGLDPSNCFLIVVPASSRMPHFSGLCGAAKARTISPLQPRTLHVIHNLGVLPFLNWQLPVVQWRPFTWVAWVSRISRALLVGFKKECITTGNIVMFSWGLNQMEALGWKPKGNKPILGSDSYFETNPPVEAASLNLKITFSQQRFLASNGKSLLVPRFSL